MSGCVCHILHNASCKAASLFSNITSFDREGHCVDLYHWFDKSSKHKNILSEHYDFCDMEYSEVIKFVSLSFGLPIVFHLYFVSTEIFKALFSL